jgi:hypothetical protein
MCKAALLCRIQALQTSSSKNRQPHHTHRHQQNIKQHPPSSLPEPIIAKPLPIFLTTKEASRNQISNRTHTPPWTHLDDTSTPPLTPSHDTPATPAMAAPHSPSTYLRQASWTHSSSHNLYATATAPGNPWGHITPFRNTTLAAALFIAHLEASAWDTAAAKIRCAIAGD